MKQIQCKTCKTLMEIPPEYFGHQLECPGCGWRFLLRDKAESKEPAPTRTTSPRQAVPETSPLAPAPFNLDMDTAPLSQTDSFPSSTGAGFTKRNSRAYTHVRCRGSTEITDPEFTYMANPLAYMKRTYCSECEEIFDVHEFSWSDTNERLTDYYARYLKKASSTQKLFASLSNLFIFGGGLVFGLVGTLLGLMLGTVAAIIGFLVFTLIGVVVLFKIYEFIMNNIILESAFGTNDPRMLN